jgi:hypothetical protein
MEKQSSTAADSSTTPSEASKKTGQSMPQISKDQNPKPLKDKKPDDKA